MFEHSSLVTAPSSARAATLPVSVGLHLVAGITALFATVWFVEFPATPPDQFSLIPVIQTPRVPDPSPAGPAKRAEPVTPVRPQTTAPEVPATPREIPDAIPELMEAVQVAIASTGTGGSQAQSGATGESVGSGVDGSVGDGSGAGSLFADAAPLRAGGDVLEPRVLRRVDPVYPNALVKTRREGIVVVECVIDRRGEVRSAQVLRSPHPLFDKAALDAVRQWKFAPGSLNGRPVDVVFVLTVRFQIA